MRDRAAIHLKAPRSRADRYERAVRIAQLEPGAGPERTMQADRVLNIVDEVAPECLAALPDTSISGRRVARELKPAPTLRSMAASRLHRFLNPRLAA